MLRAYIISGVAGLLLAVPLTGLAAQAADGNPTAVLVGGPNEGTRAPEFSLPWATKETVGSRRLARTSCGATGVRPWFSPSTRPTSPRAAPRSCRRSPTSTTPSSAPTSWCWESAPTRWRATSASPRVWTCRSGSSAIPTSQVARKYASNGDGGRAKRTVFVIGPDGRVKYRNMKFNALDPKDYSALGSAVEAARGG